MDHCDNEQSPGEGTFSLSFVTDQKVNLHYAFHCNVEEKKKNTPVFEDTHSIGLLAVYSKLFEILQATDDNFSFIF